MSEPGVEYAALTLGEENRANGHDDAWTSMAAFLGRDVEEVRSMTDGQRRLLFLRKLDPAAYLEAIRD